MLFWNIFDPGTIDEFGCNGDPAGPRYVAMGLFALYLLLTIIILLNTLIAIMSNSVNEISEKEGTEQRNHGLLILTLTF